MKRVLFSMIAISALLFAFSSCGGEKLLTEEELAQQVDEISSMQIDSLSEVLDLECEEKLEGYVTTLRDSIITSWREEGAKEGSK